MPKSIEVPEIDLGHETPAEALERALNVGKKYRHQNYSKNIYIGTKNAEKWELTRTKLSFKNDVEFVSYLLTLADTDFNNSGGRIHDGGGSVSSFPIHAEQHNIGDKLQRQGDVCNSSRVSETSEKPATTKKVKKVQFQDSANGLSNCSKSAREHFANMRKTEQLANNFSVLSQNSQDAQDNSITSTIESFGVGTVGGGSDVGSMVPEVLDCRIAEKIKNEMEQKFIVENGIPLIKSDPGLVDEALCLAKNKVKYAGAFDAINDRNPSKKESVSKSKRKQRSRNASVDGKTAPTTITTMRVCTDLDLKKTISIKIKNTKHDIRKAPLAESLEIQLPPKKPEIALQPNGMVLDEDGIRNKFDFMDSDKEGDEAEFDTEDEYNSGIEDGEDDDEEEEEDDEVEDIIPEEAENDISKINLCSYCQEDHTLNQCPIRLANTDVPDAIGRENWQEKCGKDIEKPIKKEEEDSGDENHIDYFHDSDRKVFVSYSEMSVPSRLELKQINDQVYSIFAKGPIEKYTRFGPLIAPEIAEVDIPDDCTMQSLIELFDGGKSTFYSIENKDDTNWVRFLRPAATPEGRNVVLVAVDGKAYFVTNVEVEEGCELLYWSDDCNSAWGRKKIEKMNCGGCNLKFEHPLYYRNHCSVFHDPAFSLTIRKYHCKICGSSILGKENIMKHAAQMHDGKGAYQCQYCKKFFLRLNYLEMHRTYGCSANPQRARPLCDFCGRKFCQPQKLKVHIKRMHSDMADVLRDFQCKLCSKLLGSRAALQRHSKEVHSRNSAVVSCPRCQKLFQNRSNLKIHMLTHSGVRPFKCIEGECHAAFTTKQCLQFHYKKVHSYAQEQMPKIERSVAYTFDAYSGGMKVEHLVPAISEQATRRRRKSLDDQSSAVISQMVDQASPSDNEFSDSDNIFENFKKSGKSISNICKNEPNLTLLSSKISSILEQGMKHRKREKKSRAKVTIADQLPPPLPIPLQMPQPQDDQPRRNSMLSELPTDIPMDNKAQEEFLQSLHQKRQQQNKQLSLIESFLSTATPRSSVHEDDMESNMDMPTSEHNSYKTENDPDAKIRDLSISTVPNIIPSKGSRKWISTNENSDSRNDGDIENDNENDNNLTSKLTQPNRDFLSRLIMNGAQTEDDDENSSFLDVVDTNNGGTSGSTGGHHVMPGQYSNSLSGSVNNLPQLPHLSSLSHLHAQPFIGSFYNNNGSTGNLNTNSSAASMLVEAALSTVGNMIQDDDDDSCLTKNGSNENHDNHENMNNSMEVGMSAMQHQQQQTHHLNQNQHPSNQTPTHDNRFSSNMNTLNSLENEIKMIKSMGSFPLQISTLPHFSNTGSSSMVQSTSNTSPIDDNNLPQDNDIDVDTASTPQTAEPTDKMYADNENFVNSNHHQHQQTPPTPHVLSPGRDYAMYNSTNNISPQLSQISRRNYPDHELISPASSPALPRYGGFRLDMCRGSKRSDHEDQGSHNMPSMDGRNSQQHNMSSDDENSIMAQNLSMGSHNNNSTEEMRMKFNPPQMDMMYSKYENNSGANNGSDLSDMRAKYMDHSMDVPNFRSSTDGMNDMQGLDMTARPNLSTGFHHNFQLPTSTANNIGRYHHHIYDILSEREQQQEQQHQLQHQHMQHLLQDQMATDQEQDQTTSVDLSRSSNYAVSSPPPLPYSHPHTDMLRMSSLDLAPNSVSGMGNRSFLSQQPLQHSARDGLEHHRFLSSSDQHRLLATNGVVGADQLSGNHRLIVDPATHLLMEQNSRLLSSDQSRLLTDGSSNRHMVSPRGFGAYHQVSSANYHHSVRPLSSPNHHAVNPTSYHPFPSYYQ